jgi:hypothetical protein
MTTNDEKIHRFNYHDEPDNSFLQWALLTWISGDNELYSTLAAVTDNFKQVELEIRVNNVAIDAVAFMKRLDQGVDNAVDRGVKEAIKENTRLHELEDVLSTFTHDVRREALAIVRDLGIDVDVDEEDYR